MKKLLTVAAVALAATALLLSGACSKSGGSSDPAQALMDHMKAIFKAMKDNKDDCAKMAAEVKGYVEKNKADIEALAKQAKEMEAKMSEEEKKQWEEKMKKQAEEMLKDSMAVMMEIGTKCPNEMKEVGEAMQVMEAVK